MGRGGRPRAAATAKRAGDGAPPTPGGKKNLGKKTIEINAITEGIIWKQLLIFFFPIMLGTLIQQLYTTVDTIIVGRFVGKAALASEGRPGADLSTVFLTLFNGMPNGAALFFANY